MRIELKEIQQDLGMTFVYVTHDQEEAMTMSDRIVVMSDGAIEQDGAPGAIYRRPRTAFVADFIGKSNILRVAGAAPQGDLLRLRLADSEIELLSDDASSEAAGDVRCCCIRPESVLLEPGSGAEAGLNLLQGDIRKIVNLGAHAEIWTAVGPGKVVKALVITDRASKLMLDQPVTLGIPASAVTVLAR
jgi:ABC-type Fe3+/spermidine/putrescine transport system ATPase subunit